MNRSGWTVGGGLEWMFAPGLSVFGEFNYMDFGSRNVNFVKAPGTVPTDVRTFFAPGSRSSSSWWA